MADVYGNLAPDTGLFQSSAGYYAGTWSGGGESGTLQGVLSADGQLYFVSFDSSGAINEGGQGQLDAAGRFSTTSVDGSVVTGTNYPASLKIMGTFANSEASGKFTMTRAAIVPVDVPPAITVPPADQNVQSGQNGIFTVTATGSPPLCYQWYSNDVFISQATASTLVVSNVQAANDSTVYSVLVQNLAGATNASATLRVVPETTPPKLNIVFPAPGQRVSNTVAMVTVTGTASDNVAVSNVWVQIDGTGWIMATGTVNWAASLPMMPGSNTVSAYAVDTSGNYSPTNNVNFVYVQSGQLIVQANGKGRSPRTTATPGLQASA